MGLIMGSIFGMIIDLIFLTNLCQRKNSLTNKKYCLMIGIMSIITILEICLFKEYRIMAEAISYLFLIYIFYGNINALSLFSFSFTLLSCIEVYVYSCVNPDYKMFLLIMIPLKLFAIFTVFKEINDLNINIKFKSITQKVLYIIFAFICLCFGIYINLVWR